MTKRDTIIVAVLFNLVILACVLATAQQITHPETPIAVEVKEEPQGLPTQTEPENPVAYDEIDKLLEEYISNSKEKERSKKEDSSEKNSGQFYIVCPGDNPWKIAKKFNISFERLLSLNNLDEHKARNLKIGQTLRIREVNG